MVNSSFYNFLILNLWKHKTKHLVVFFISIMMVFVLSSVMFLSSSLQKSIYETLDMQPDMIVQKIGSGKVVDMPISWIDEISRINGVSLAIPRVYGQYWFEQMQTSFTIVGIDFYDDQVVATMKELVEDIDVRAFLQKPQMIVGNGVKEFLAQYKYDTYYNFRTPSKTLEQVYIYKTLPKELNSVANDMIFMPMDLAKKVLGLEQDKVTDIILNVPNEAERENIKVKLILQNQDSRIIQKSDIENAYENMFNYKGGIFLVLYLISLLTFVLILYQRYWMISSTDKKEIGILRSVGWSIKNVLLLKVVENFIVAIFAFAIGVIVAYVFVFVFNAPLLSEIFFGAANIGIETSYVPYIPFGLLFELFALFVVPFISAILIPVWRIAILDPVESMR